MDKCALIFLYSFTPKEMNLIFRNNCLFPCMLLKMSRKYDGDQKIHATEFGNSKHAESFNNLYNNYTIGYLWYATLSDIPWQKIADISA